MSCCIHISHACTHTFIILLEYNCDNFLTLLFPKPPPLAHMKFIFLFSHVCIQSPSRKYLDSSPHHIMPSVWKTNLYFLICVQNATEETLDISYHTTPPMLLYIIPLMFFLSRWTWQQYNRSFNPSFLPTKSRDEIFLRGENCHDPKCKNMLNT